MKIDKNQVQQLNPQMQKLDRKMREASQMYEEQFLRHMVRAMRNSVDHAKMTAPSMAEGIYREQLDDEYVQSWVKQGGVGFGEMIYQDLAEKFYPQMGIRHKPKEIRPMNLSDRFQGISRSLTEKAQKKHTFLLEMGPQKTEKSYLQLPWQGKLEKEFEMEDGQKVALFSHPSGLKSTFVFQGKMEPGLLNKTLSEGENFAQLSPESQNLTWQIEDANSRKDSSELKNSDFIKE